MAKIYRHRAMRSDDHIGSVDKDGNVYREKFGPDEYIGRVDYESGKVYVHRKGIDDYLGSVTDDGKVKEHTAVAVVTYSGPCRVAAWRVVV